MKVNNLIEIKQGDIVVEKRFPDELTFSEDVDIKSIEECHPKIINNFIQREIEGEVKQINDDGSATIVVTNENDEFSKWDEINIDCTIYGESKEVTPTISTIVIISYPLMSSDIVENVKNGETMYLYNFYE